MNSCWIGRWKWDARPDAVKVIRGSERQTEDVLGRPRLSLSFLFACSISSELLARWATAIPGLSPEACCKFRAGAICQEQTHFHTLLCSPPFWVLLQHLGSSRFQLSLPTPLTHVLQSCLETHSFLWNPFFRALHHSCSHNFARSSSLTYSILWLYSTSVDTKCDSRAIEHSMRMWQQFFALIWLKGVSDPVMVVKGVILVHATQWQNSCLIYHLWAPINKYI